MTGDNGSNSGAQRILVSLFLFSMMCPLVLNIGTIRLSPYRLVLIVAFFPALIALFRGRAGKIRFGDICVFFICLWQAVCLSVIHGFGVSAEQAGIFTIETMGAYLIGRCYIRGPADFLNLARTLLIMAIIMAPFALVETLTGKNVLLSLFDLVGSVYPDIYKDKRWGLDRVQGPFEHPILMGVFFGAFVGLVFYVLGYKKSPSSRLQKAGTMFLVSASSLSSGPLSTLMAQIIFISWDRIFQRFPRRWYAYAGLAVLAYIVIDVFSNRNPFQVFIHYLAFNASTAYNRLLIFEWGMVNIFENPIFGLGNNNWKRLWYMTPSFDMYWLVNGIRYGMPGVLSNLLLFGWAFFSIVFKKMPSERIQWYRLGYTSSMFGFFLVGWTVHFWNATYVIFVFFLASGLWMLDYKNDDQTAGENTKQDEVDNRKIRYTRFPTKVN